MNQHIDVKFKDASPAETIKKVKQLLADRGITVTENWNETTVKNCYSLRLMIDGTLLGTNGKGVTEELANASAHAELMERLQSGFLGYGARKKQPDAKMLDRQAMKETCGKYFEEISQTIFQCDGITVPPEQLLEVCYEYDNSDVSEVLPYYNATEGAMTYLPTQLANRLTHSTGLCAGNTPEEAIVQGFSEIIERWNQRHFMCDGIVPPTIPDSYLQNFPAVYEIICDIREKGLDVLIKDCSMGTGYPVIAAAVLSKENHAYHVHFGASPIFEIALKRCLTETFQGRVIHSVAENSLSKSAVGDVGVFRDAFLKGNGAFPIEFFTEESSFPFVPFEDRSQCSNRDLLGYIVKFLKERNMTMYVRDISYMGFLSYKIVVPQLCDTHFGFLTSVVPVAALTGSTAKVRRDLKNATEDQLFEIQMLNSYMINDYFVDRNPSSKALLSLPLNLKGALDSAVGIAHVAYVEWACGNYGAAYSYMKTIGDLKIPGFSDYFSCLAWTNKLIKAGNALDKALEKLSLFYKEAVISEVKETVENKLNPFRNYIVHCKTDDSECKLCRYEKNCYVKYHRRITKILDQCMVVFDNQKAFEKMAALFESL